MSAATEATQAASPPSDERVPCAPVPLRERDFLVRFSALFFLSGMAGLVYEVLWMRRFGLVMGNASVSLSAVLTAFMSGLAVGSWIGGRIADRTSGHLRMYGMLEIAIGLYALVVPLLISATQPVLSAMYGEDNNSAALQIVRFALASAIMLVPTTFMGATLPLLIKRFTRSASGVGGGVGLLYGINSIGAMAGAFLAGFVLIPNLGMMLTNLVAVAVNIGVGVYSIRLSRRPALDAASASGAGNAADPASAADHESAHPGLSQPPTAEDFAVRRARIVALAAVGVSGLAAMIYQVGWTRIFALLLGSSTYAFSLILVATIGGISLGGLVFGWLADRMRRGLLLLAAVQFFTAVAAMAVTHHADDLPFIAAELIQRRMTSHAGLLVGEFMLIGACLFVPTFLMGGMFPVTARICAPRLDRLGATVGNVYAVNTVGAVIGSFSTGLLLMRFLGIGWTLVLAMVLNLAVAAVAVFCEAGLAPTVRRALAGVAGAALLALLIFPPTWEKEVMASGPYRYYRYNLSPDSSREDYLAQATKADMVYYRDDISGTVTVLRGNELPFSELAITINGKPDASNTPADAATMLLTGHLGMILHPEAKSVMHLGLGAGLTLDSILAHDSVERVDVIEISPAVVEAVRLFFGEANNHALDDPRVNLIMADGRNHLALTSRKYDLIVSQPSNPWIAGISSLFTAEFFRLCLDRLNDDGMVCAWIHLYNMRFEDFMTVVRTFCETVPHATLWEANDADYLLVGSKRPIRIDWRQFAGRIGGDKVFANLQSVRLGNPNIIASMFIAGREGLLAHPACKDAPLNVDDTLVLEFSAPKAYYQVGRDIKQSRIYELQQNPLDVFDARTLPDDVRIRLESVPKVRALMKQVIDLSLQRGGQLSAQEVQRVESALTEALRLNPYDIYARIQLYQFYFDLAQAEANAQMIQEARRHIAMAIEVYEFLGIAYFPGEIGNMYNLSFMLAAYTKDAPTAKRSRQKILDLAGDRGEEYLKLLMDQ